MKNHHVVWVLMSLTLAVGNSPLRAQTTVWHRTNGLYGGDVRCFAAIGTTLFAEVYGGGLYSSTNNGDSWSPIIPVTHAPDSMLSFPPLCLASSDTTLFAGTHMGGLCRSTNNGITWTTVLYREYGFTVYSLILRDTFLFAGTGNGLFRSTNEGDTWTRLDSLLPGSSYGSLALSGRTLFAATIAGVYKSTNNGDTWDSTAAMTRMYSLAANGATIFAIPIYDSSAVYRSIDEGSHWAQCNNDFPHKTEWTALSVQETTFFAGSDSGTYRSTNNGDSWSLVRGGLRGGSTNGAIYQHGSFLFGGTDFGAFRSSDGGDSWTQVNNGIKNLRVSPVGIIGNILLASTWNGTFRSLDDGESWSEVVSGSSPLRLTDIVTAGTLMFAGNSIGRVLRSTDSGGTWENTGLVETYSSTVAALGAYIFAPTNHGVFRSSDSGTSWTLVNHGLTDTFIVALYVYGTSLYARATRGSMYHSTNGGDSWAPIDFGLPQFFGISIIGDNLYAISGEHGILRSKDNGNSWVATNSGLADSIVDYMYAAGKLLFAVASTDNLETANEEILYISSNSGDTWSSISWHSGIPCLLENGTSLYEGTSDGLYYCDFPVNGVHPHDLPTNPGLHFSFQPNPATSTVHLHFGDAGSRPEISIYNILGECVLNARGDGLEETVVDVSSIRPGVYIASVTVGTVHALKLVTIVR